MTLDYTDTLERYLQQIGVKFKVSQDYNDKATGWQTNANHYRVTISRFNRSMTFWFYQGYGIKSDPTLASVIESLNSDRLCATYTLQEFGDQFGWDSNTLPTYRLLQDLNKRYERVIGHDSILENIDKIIRD